MPDMLPERTIEPEVLQDLKVIQHPSLGWGIDFEKKRVTAPIDGVGAVKQAIRLICSTERYALPIHTWDYGVELTDLYGANSHFTIPLLQQRILDALEQDDRITDIKNLQIEQTKKNTYSVYLEVTTVFNEDADIGVEVVI